MSKKYSKELESKIVELYNNGISPYKIVKIVPELNSKRPSVIYGVLRRLGIKSHKQFPLTDKQRKARRKYDVNDDFFETINTEEKAYWLGFMYADGYVTTVEDKVGISLAIKDRSHLLKFKNSLSSESPINDYEQLSGYNAGSWYSRILITSSKMKKDLMFHGVAENKTNILKFPTYKHVPKNLIYHFIRGYIDGDGSLTHSNVSYLIKITGTKEILVGIQNEFGTNVTYEERFPERKVNNYQITIGGNKQVKRLLYLLYKNSSFYLDRKYNKYQEICNHLSSMVNATGDHR